MERIKLFLIYTYLFSFLSCTHTARMVFENTNVNKNDLKIKVYNPKFWAREKLYIWIPVVVQNNDNSLYTIDLSKFDVKIGSNNIDISQISYCKSCSKIISEFYDYEFQKYVPSKFNEENRFINLNDGSKYLIYISFLYDFYPQIKTLKSDTLILSIEINDQQNQVELYKYGYNLDF